MARICLSWVSLIILVILIHISAVFCKMYIASLSEPQITMIIMISMMVFYHEYQQHHDYLRF
ncbi:hypothetical protein QUF70_18165 [Desulfobacterales bacterium HSG17]|nr:hypothetical protein [Desulfobacterales bacterium HSG17]